MPPFDGISEYIMPPLGIIIKYGGIHMYFQRISDLRQDHDLTQQQVADILHCKREVYRRYEKGIREIPVSYAITLAQYYHVSLDYLLGLKDTKN